MKNKLVLIDGNSIIYRAFFALPLLNNDKGVYTNAVYGFTTMLMRILDEEKPTHMLVAFDAGKTTFRHETYSEYKGGRQKTPSELSEQFPVLKDLLKSFDIKHYELPQYEADDIIGTLSAEAESGDWDITVISGDKDMLQLVSDKTTVSLTRKGITDVEKYTPSFLEEKMEVTPEQVIDLKALMGDNSDNVPGVPGVGQKTAVKLIKQFGTLDAVYESLDEVSGKKLKENLENHKEDAFMSRELVTIKRDSPIEIGLEDAVYQGYDPKKLAEAFKDLGFNSLLNKVQGADELEPEELEELADIEFKTMTEIETGLFSDRSALIVELLGDNYHKEPIDRKSVV